MKKEKKGSPKAVVMSLDTHDKLTKLCKAHGSNMKDFTAQMVTYFEKTGIDPSDVEGTDLKEAIKGLRKENNRVIGFIKQQEKMKLEPILDELANSSIEFRKRSRSLDRIGELGKEIVLLKQKVGTEISNSEGRKEEAVEGAHRTGLRKFMKYLGEQEKLRRKGMVGSEHIRWEELAQLNEKFEGQFRNY